MQMLETFTSALRGRMIPVAQNSETSKQRGEGRGINRWALYKQLCVAKTEFGLNDRCLAVLSSLLSFLPGDELSEKTDLVVFPSNRNLSLRAHGMPESTLRRHLSSLISAGIIARKDSPTRKRYAHKSEEGDVKLAFGFSFAPLLQRASDIARISEQLGAAAKALKCLRDEVSVVRRDIAAQFAEGMSDEFENLFVRFRTVVDAIPRRASAEELVSVKAELEAIQREMAILLENKDNVEELSGGGAQIERQHTESLPESLFESKNEKLNDLKGCLPATHRLSSEGNSSLKPQNLSLDMVLRCCPDIRTYAAKGIGCWRDLLDAARVVSSFLGISETAWREATAVLGREGASTIIAWMLQRTQTIKSAGGYLRTLSERARQGKLNICALMTAPVSSERHVL